MTMADSIAFDYIPCFSISLEFSDAFIRELLSPITFFSPGNFLGIREFKKSVM
jgi:hypothetical protein